MSKMRNTLVALAAVGAAGVVAAVPATAQAAPSGEAGTRSANCDSEYRGLAPGLMAAFAGTKCTSPLGIDRGEEWSWGDNRGQLRGSDNNRASSLVNKGTGTVSTVVFYKNAGYSGGHICLTKGEKYADSLGSDDRFSTGGKANNAISSHAWTTPSRCSKFMD